LDEDGVTERDDGTEEGGESKSGSGDSALRGDEGGKPAKRDGVNDFWRDIGLDGNRVGEEGVRYVLGARIGLGAPAAIRCRSASRLAGIFS